MTNDLEGVNFVGIDTVGFSYDSMLFQSVGSPFDFLMGGPDRAGADRFPSDVLPRCGRVGELPCDPPVQNNKTMGKCRGNAKPFC